MVVPFPYALRCPPRMPAARAGVSGSTEDVSESPGAGAGVTCKETGHGLSKSQEAHEGVQNTPPHDEPLLHVDYFELKLIKT